MANDDPQLWIAIEARQDRFEKSLARIQRTANDNMKQLERRAQQAGRAMDESFAGSASKIAAGMEKMFAPFLRGGVVFAGVTGAAMALKSVANSIAEVDREARKAGVSAQVWQQWSYVATATGATVDGITDALKELNIRANEFALTGKGSGAEWFDRLGYSAGEVGRKLQDPNRFIDELIGKIQKLDAGSRTRALDELFGGTGAEQLAKMLGLSVEQIQKLRSEAASFTDDQIEAAKKIDAEFETLWRNVRVYAKQAAIESVGYAEKIIRALRGEWLPGYDKQQKAYDYLFSDQAKLDQAVKQRERIQAQLKAARELPDDYFGKTTEVRQLEAALQAVEEQIIDLGGGSDELKRGLKELSDMTQRAGGAFNNTATMATNFKTALNELKSIVPELKTELDTLAKLDGIDEAFRKVVGNAQTMSQVMGAVDIANRAKSIVQFGKHDNILDLIGAAEGTDKGRGYNETLGYGAFTGGAVNLTSMSLNEVLALQKRMLAHPDNKYNSSAVGRYQIVSSTLQDAMKDLNLTGDRKFDEDTQDEIARYLLRRRGNDPAGLRNEWEGLRRVDDGTIRDAYAGTPVAAQKLAPTDAQQKAIDLANQQTEARKRLNQAIDEGLSRAQFEQSISGMSDQQKQLELAVYDRIAQAKRDGITLTDQEIAKMREKIAQTQQLNAETRNTTVSQEQLAEAGKFFEQQIGNAITGLITGTMTAEQALQQLLASLAQALLQAALLGQGPLGGLVGGKGILSGIFAGVFAAGGGYISGPGTSTSDSIPARLSDGEYVVNAAATAKHRPLLEAINSGHVRAFASGGGVDGKRVGGLAVGNTQNTTFAPAISINVEGGSKGREADQELAAKLGAEMETLLDAKMSEFAQKQMRAGGMFNRGAFG